MILDKLLEEWLQVSGPWEYALERDGEGEAAANLANLRKRTRALAAEQPEQIPVAWLHTYKKPGKMYTLADLSEHGPEPDEGFEHVGKQPLYIQPSSSALRRSNAARPTTLACTEDA